MPRWQRGRARAAPRRPACARRWQRRAPGWRSSHEEDGDPRAGSVRAAGGMRQEECTEARRRQAIAPEGGDVGLATQRRRVAQSRCPGAPGARRRAGYQIETARTRPFRPSSARLIFTMDHFEIRDGAMYAEQVPLDAIADAV